MTILLLIISLLASLFILFSLSKNDFVLVRQNISLKEIFDAAFLGFIGFLFASRIWFVVIDNNLSLLSPIKFFHFLRFPGLGFVGGALGFLIISYIIFNKKKALPRILDIFSLSLIPIAIFSIVIVPTHGPELVIKSLLTLTYIILLSLFIFFHKKYIVRDGTIAMICFGVTLGLNAIWELVNGGNRLINFMPSFFFTSLVLFSLVIFSIFYRSKRV